MNRLTNCLIAALFAMFLSNIIAIETGLTANAKMLYIAKDGNDTWRGNIPAPNTDRTDGPLATLEGARNSIRNMKINGQLSSPVTVQVRGGTYYLENTFVLEPQDSGSKECPIAYMAYPGENVIISGGRQLNAQWTTYRGEIKVCTIPDVRQGKWYFRSLFVNGKRQIRARTPNEGFFNVADRLYSPDSLVAFRYTPGDFKRLSNFNDIDILLFHFWDDSRLIISDLDEENHIVKFTGEPNSMYNRWSGKRYNGENDRYYVENVFEELDAPGEWYLNRNTGELYYLPMPGENVNDSEIIAPALQQLLLIQGDAGNNKPAEYVKFKGLTFCHADWPLPPEGHRGGWGDFVSPSAITLENARHCVIEKSHVTNVGTYGIELNEGCIDNTIDKNEISHTGSGGIRIDGRTTMRNLISNNHVHHCCSIYPSGVGIAESSAGQNCISHNHVHDTGYCGITARGPVNTIEYNHVHHVMQRLSDGAGFYTHGGRSDGTIIRNNIFHDIKPAKVFGWGIYLDDLTEYVTVVNNIVYRVETGGTMIHGNRYCSWVNNIFIDGGKYQIFFDTINNYSYHNIYDRNIFYYTDPDSKLIHNAYMWSKSAMERSDYNLFYCAAGGTMAIEGIKEQWPNSRVVLYDVKTFEDWRKLGFEFHSIVADPLFVDPKNDNYTLQENSPAFQLGFRQIDISTVGPQD